MAHQEEMLVHGVLTRVTKFDHSAQEIDDAVDLANNALARDGSNAMTGNLTLPSLQCTALTTPTKIGKYLDFHNTDTTTRTMRLYAGSDSNDFFINVPNVGDYTILHTGNKPSGSYTGNGDETTRTIDTGGIGNVAFVYNDNSAYTLTIVLTFGAFVLKDATTPKFLQYSECHIANGVLTVASTNAALNTSGKAYKYKVL